VDHAGELQRSFRPQRGAEAGAGGVGVRLSFATSSVHVLASFPGENRFGKTKFNMTLAAEVVDRTESVSARWWPRDSQAMILTINAHT
jgi:hypothetical protein